MYAMPVWMGLLAHFFLPGERMSATKAAGLALALLGMAWAIRSKGGGGHVTLTGDLLALVAAWGWAGTAIVARKSRPGRCRTRGAAAPDGSGLAPPASGRVPGLRAVPARHIAHALGLAFDPGRRRGNRRFVTWLWLLSVYPTSTVASFSFLTPLPAIFLGHVIFAELLSPSLIGAGALVSCGILLINRRA